jgi:K(+)-stimulated pyrophosphate-energized sodium pump
MSARLRFVASSSLPTIRPWLNASLLAVWTLLISGFLAGGTAFAGEADLLIPDLTQARFFNESISGWNLLFFGSFVIGGTLGISLWLRSQIKALPAHDSMLKVADIIFETCKTYLLKQAQFLALLFAMIAAAMAYYFLVLKGEPIGTLLLVLLFSIVGIGGSFWVAWFGIRVNTYANARTAFASLRGEPWDVVNIPLRAGMSIGLFLISLELIMMVIILLFVPRNVVGYCFLGFAIGESLGASALRIAGGIFTKIADIGSDLMKIAFNVKEDDPRNPGVIADCTGDNAGDSVGPTADVHHPRRPQHRHPGEAHRLDFLHAVSHGSDVGGVVLPQSGDLREEVQGAQRVRFRGAAHPPDLDRVDPLHRDVLSDELSPHR